MQLSNGKRWVNPFKYYTLSFEQKVKATNDESWYQQLLLNVIVIWIII
jgi:hypothetical protein